MTDVNNCGQCNKACGGGTPYCINGTCSAGVTFTAAFAASGATTAQCTAWQNFDASLSAGGFSGIQFFSSADATGVTCTGTAANQICVALATGTAVSVSCGGNTWNVGSCDGTELVVNAGVCACTTAPSHDLRPCLADFGFPTEWGDVTATADGTTSCAAPAQTVTVKCY
jgi:hypothetical protein